MAIENRIAGVGVNGVASARQKNPVTPDEVHRQDHDDVPGEKERCAEPDGIAARSETHVHEKEYGTERHENGNDRDLEIAIGDQC